MLWMLMSVVLASGPEITASGPEITAETVESAAPSLLEQARLNRLWLSSDDNGVAESAAQIQQTLDRYNEQADKVFIGEVVGVYHPGGHAVQGTRMSVMVSEVIRGKVPAIIEVHLPPAGGYIHGDPDTAPITILTGYQVLVFTDKRGQAVTSNALFLIEGGFIWRNKKPDAYLNPRIARDWAMLTDPSQDYLTASLSAVKQQLARH